MARSEIPLCSEHPGPGSICFHKGCGLHQVDRSGKNHYSLTAGVKSRFSTAAREHIADQKAKCKAARVLRQTEVISQPEPDNELLQQHFSGRLENPIPSALPIQTEEQEKPTLPPLKERFNLRGQINLRGQSKADDRQGSIDESLMQDDTEPAAAKEQQHEQKLADVETVIRKIKQLGTATGVNPDITNVLERLANSIRDYLR